MNMIINNIRTKLIGLFTATCFAIAPAVLAVSPAPDGGYANQNTAEGEDALFDLSSGFFNTAVGYHALYGDTSGSLNTALGAQALLENSTGRYNTATGSQALLGNTTGARNTANGSDALLYNSSGENNTAMGSSAMALNSTGSGNTAIGREALSNNSTGRDNIALGIMAGRALSTGSHNIDIGNPGVAGESNGIRIGTVGTQSATFIAGISGTTVADGVGVVVGGDGRLGTVTSSARFKDRIKPIGKASEAILSLQPVTFCYKHELDPSGTPQFGLVAEQVEKVDPDLVARDAAGKPYTVRYEAVNAMLLNEFLKEHQTVAEQKATIAELKSSGAKQEKALAEQQKEIAALRGSLKEQAAEIQKVSDQLAGDRPAPRVVTSN